MRILKLSMFILYRINFQVVPPKYGTSDIALDITVPTL